MARSVDYRTTAQYPADEVYAAMVDEEHLRARLVELGGPGAQLLEHSASAEAARYRLRHGLDPSVLPPLVKSLVPGEMAIERTEALRREAQGRYRGEVDVRILGAPATAAGTMRLADTDGTGGGS